MWGFSVSIVPLPFLLNNSYPQTLAVLNRPCKSVSHALVLSQPYISNATMPATQTQSSQRSALYQQGSAYILILECTRTHRLPNSPPHTLSILNPSGISPKLPPNLIWPTHFSFLGLFTPIMLVYFKPKHQWSEDIFLLIIWLATVIDYQQQDIFSIICTLKWAKA